MIRELKFLKNTGVRIGIAIALTMLTLLALLNLFFISQSKNSFVDVVKTVTIGPISEITSEGEIKQYNILRFYQDGTERPVPLQDEFVKRFQDTIFIISIISLFVSIAIAYVAAQFFSRPLKLLTKGMNKLRESNYKIKLEKTGTGEFDEVINEFNNLTDELNRIEELRRDLISDTSHELKTPITSLIGQLQGIRDGILEADDKRVELLLMQVERINDMVERLQEFSRLRNKTRTINITEINVFDSLKYVKSLFHDDLKSCKIKFTLDVDKKLKIKADKEMFERIFINLLQNSLKYAECAKIFIKYEDNKLIFEDNGVGISDEHKKLIFERFYRIEKSRNRTTGGLGLGLAIVKEIVSLHNWKINVEDNPGGGVRFVINLA